MKRFIILMALALSLLPLCAQVELRRPNLNPFSLDGALPGLKMNHSMGFEAATGTSGAGYYLSRYTNHLNYQLSSKLDLNLNLNFVNFGSMQSTKGLSFADDNKSQLLPDFSLRYRPNESFSMEVKVGSAVFENGFYHSLHRGFPWD